MKKLVMMCLGLVMACSLVACGSESKDDKKLTVLTNSGYDPYELVDEDGNLYGFDIDVMNKAAEIAGYEVKWKDIDFDAIVESIKQGKGDVAIAGITYTAERAKQVSFSDVYYAGEDAQNYVLTMKDSSMSTTEDIKGKKIGTQMGTIQEAILEDLKDEYNIEIDKRKNYSDLAIELDKGVVDCMVVEKAVADKLMAKNENFTAYKLEAGAELAGNAMIFAKDNEELKEKFNAAIQEMKDNGEMDKLVKKYFD
ncbi:MAG: amino acid ABC transporter substrate-binding protein [Erysipelotrichia bacterium]|nr:amino acid ABC transporter substrate-binding protein [Erysipelotrichia bacterium]NCC54676.1 amino acid ABC transporter substrate-binding protein [Erysipelotrichia bacterium]